MGGVQIGGYPKLMFHCLAIIGNTAIRFSVLAIMVSYYGNMKQKQAVAGVYLCWIVGAGAIQYTHPWNDDPVSMLDMPMPLLLGISRSWARASRSRRRFAPARSLPVDGEDCKYNLKYIDRK